MQSIDMFPPEHPKGARPTPGFSLVELLGQDSREMRRHDQKRAFSLVEVVLALGLVSFAVIAILGLIPTGLTTLRQAMNQTVEAQIVKSIGARAVTANFTNLATNNMFFDDEGLPTTTAAMAVYTVNVTTNVPVFPGSSNAINYTNSLTTLRILMISKPNPAAVGTTNFYTLQVANSGK